MPLVDVMYGNEVFAEASCKVGVWVIPTLSFPTFDKEMHIATAIKKAEVPVSLQGKHESYSARSDGYRDELGTWQRCTIQAAEGLILKIFARNNRGYGRQTVIANQYIRVREQAAYNELKVALTGHTGARYDYAYITGRFDILSLEQALERGVKVEPRLQNTFDPDHVAKIVEVIQKEAEISAMQEITTKEVMDVEGNTKVIKVAKRKRNLLLSD